MLSLITTFKRNLLIVLVTMIFAIDAFANTSIAISSIVTAQTTTSSLKRKKINFNLPHLKGKVDIDGNLSEPVWQNALQIELNYETKPAENKKPPVQTLVSLFEDGQKLYIAFDARDSHPEEIRDFLLDRDNIWNSDFVGIKFDTFGESRKAFQFFTNAKGIQADAIQEDFRGDDSSWDAIWDSAATITQKGYAVEMAIPFQALRFPSNRAEQVWGIEALRFYPRKAFHRIANAPVDRNIACQICQFDQLIGMKNIKRSKNVTIIPTLVSSKNSSRGETTGDWQSSAADNTFGVDARWGISDDTYLNATINPDFSQIEADDVQLDVNNTFSLSVDEKRPFFLDGSDYFNTLQRIVHTRDIIEPEYGLKLTGQSNGHSYGAIVVNDKHTSFLLPSSQSSELLLLENEESQNQIFRYQYDLGNKNTIGFLTTNKTAGEYRNTVSSIDGSYWFNEFHSIEYQLLHSESHYSEQMMAEYSRSDDSVDPLAVNEPGISEQSISDNSLFLNYDFRTKNWIAKVRYREAGKDFRADLGFNRRVNVKKKVVRVERIWFPSDNKSWWDQITFGGDWDETHTIDGLKLEQEIEADFRIEGDYQSTWELGYTSRERLWNATYFDEDELELSGVFTPISGLQLSASYSMANSIDFVNTQLGESVSFSPSIQWQFNQNLFASIDYQQTKFDVSGGQLFDAVIGNYRVSYLFDEINSIRLTIQNLDIRKDQTLYESFANSDPLDDEEPHFRSVATQLLYTYKVNPQTLFFAGYSDSGFQDQRIDYIRKTQRSLFMKFSYAWQI